ncbi:G2-specific serine/threonine protein kinase [Hypoxylon texense]
MKCRGAVSTAFLAGLLAGVMAGNIVEDIRRDFDFRMGLFARQSISDFQQFKGGLGDKLPAQIQANDDDKRPFKTVGTNSDDTFTDFSAAAERVCSFQKNECSDSANQNKDSSFSVGDCDTQNQQCKDANTPTTEDDNFLYFCDD